MAKNSIGPGFSPSTSVVAPDNTIPPMLHIQLHLQDALTMTNAGNLGNREAVDSKELTFLLAVYADSTLGNFPWVHPRGAADLLALQPKFKKILEFLDTLSNVSRDWPFSRNQPLRVPEMNVNQRTTLDTVM